jgi:hypothetical protein
MFNRVSGQAVLCLAVVSTFCFSCGGDEGNGAGGGAGGGSGGGSGGGTGGGTDIPFPTVPSAIAATSNEKVAFKFFAKGTQNYSCNALTDGGYAWAFVAPDATLYAGTDETAPDAGRHYAGPTWESAADGSKFIGDSAAAKKVDSPTPATAIPWLLIPKKSVEGDGGFSVLTFAQRINTDGGVAPAAADCSSATATNVEKVPYTATYYLYTTR